MTVMEAISQTDALKPNAYGMGQKLRWLSRLEAMVQRLVLDAHGEDSLPFEGFTDSTDTNTRLFMPAPFDAAYLYWLEAQIHYANEDMDMYNSAMLMFNTVFGQYRMDYSRSHTAQDTGRFLF